jgi:quercetin dioxygenase-like cupin family protein
MAADQFSTGANDASNLTAAEISFEPGARAGDVVWTPPGVLHWHGATATQGMRHLAAAVAATD